MLHKCGTVLMCNVSIALHHCIVWLFTTDERVQFEVLHFAFVHLQLQLVLVSNASSTPHHCSKLVNCSVNFSAFVHLRCGVVRWCVWEKDEALVKIITDSHQRPICQRSQDLSPFLRNMPSNELTKILLPKNPSKFSLTLKHQPIPILKEMENWKVSFLFIVILHCSLHLCHHPHHHHLHLHHHLHHHCQ